MKFGEKEKGLLGQLSVLEKEMDQKRRRIKDIRVNMRQGRQALKKLQDDLSQLETTLQGVQGRLARRLVAFYKYAKRGAMRLFVTSRGLNQLRKRVGYLQVIMSADQQLLAEMNRIRKRQKKNIALREESLALIEGMKNLENERLASLKQDLDKKVLLLMKIHKEKEFYETAVKELESAATNLKDTLLKLDQEPVKKKEGLRLPSGFARWKGRLPVPCRGKIVKSPGPLGTGTGNQQKGIYILGPSGGEVKAVFAGRVDYSGWLKGYGQIIVINHGSRFFSVSGHLLERYKKEGDRVEKGEVIGLLGESGSLLGPRLYFEIRKGGAQMDPIRWIKVR